MKHLLYYDASAGMLFLIWKYQGSGYRNYDIDDQQVMLITGALPSEL